MGPIKRSAKRGFTLVELLVVIGIIAVLIAMLMPSLNKARQSALKVACMARMKQLNNATMLFANNNRGKLPPIFAGSATNYTFPWGYYQAIFPWDVSTPVRALDTGYLTQYMGKGIPDYRLYVCPSLEGYISPSNSGVHTYMYNRYLGGMPDSWWSIPGAGTWRDTYPYKFSRARNPSTLALYVDTSAVSYGYGTNQANGMWFRNDPAAENGSYASPKAYHLPAGGSGGMMMHQMTGVGGKFTDWNGTQANRIMGYVNIAFLDGSVRSVRFIVDRYPARALEDVRVRPDRNSLTW